MLSGGQTPLPAYRLLLAAPPPIVAETVNLFLSDERLVPPDSPESNQGRLADFFRALRVPEDRILRVPSTLAPAEAAQRYHRDLAALLGRGTRITLGLLGLGADGHTASLFTPDDLRRGAGRYAVVVPRPSGPARVSVTPELLARIEQIVFLVSGRDKDAAVEKLLRNPESLSAGLAVAGCRQVELWQA